MSKLRPPIVTVLGHIDCGKTSFLDNLRKISVKNKEVGGITQSIGTIFLSNKSIRKLTKGSKEKIGIPGIIFIDTPGHECFSDQRLSGIEVSDFVIVLIDIFKGLEKIVLQCIEQLVKNRKPFVVLANKIDKIQGWTCKKKMAPFITSIKNQSSDTKTELDHLINDTVLRFAENGLNARLYFDNPDYQEWYSIVPVSAQTGQGVPDTLAFINKMSNEFLKKRLTYKQDIVSGFIVETEDDLKLGNICSTVITDGQLSIKDHILGLSVDGEIVHQKIKSIYTKNENNLIKIDKTDLPNCYLIKIDSKTSDSNADLLAGTRFFANFKKEDEKKFQNILEGKLEKMKGQLDSFEYKDFGVLVVGSSFGTINALLNICSAENIPVNSICLGSPKKKDIIRCKLTMEKYKIVFDDDTIYKKRFGVVLNFGTKMDKKIVKLCEEEQLKVINEDIIYNLIKEYNKYKEQLDEILRKKNPNCMPEYKLKILDQYIFTKKNPIIFGVQVLKNTLYKDSTVLANLYKDIKLEKSIELGQVISIQKDRKDISKAEKGEEVCIKIEPLDKGIRYEYGTDFNSDWILQTKYSEEDQEKILKYETFLKN